MIQCPGTVQHCGLQQEAHAEQQGNVIPGTVSHCDGVINAHEAGGSVNVGVTEEQSFPTESDTDDEVHIFF